ncbi:MAG: hypothetical protein Q4E75_00870 [bacterium]|nr:hypothetical protein [bacterium]
MYIDAIIVIALVIFCFCWFRRFSKIVYSIASIDIFLRLIDYIANHIGIKEFKHFVNRVFPDSFPAIIAKYTNGIFYDILLWLYIGIMVFFLFYTIRICLRKKI